MRKRLTLAIPAGVVLALMTALPAAADPTGVDAAVEGASAGHNALAINIVWIVLAAALVIFMQAGFAMVETGFCRARHAAHVVMTNFAIFGIGGLAFFFVGFPLMFGGGFTAPTVGFMQPLGKMIGFGTHGGLFGSGGWLLGGLAYDVGVAAFFLFQVAFMDTAATIPTGAMAERWKFSAFAVFGVFMGAVLYPLYGNWVWGGGWLSQLGNSFGLGHGVVDFAGSGVVHAVGGVTALAGALVLGARKGKFSKGGKPRAIPGHHIPMAMLGTFILLFGWFGFNAGSTLAGTDLRLGIVAVNTMLAGAAGAVVAMLVMWRRFGKPDPSMSANGMLAGLVAVTAPCAFIQPWAAVLIGAVAGVVVVAVVLFVERRLKVDDPVGAVAVHGVNGLWGVVSVGIFADGTYGDGLNGGAGGVKGLLYGGGLGQLAAQLVAVAVLCTVVFGIAYAFFRIQDRVMGIRSKDEDEVAGLDLPEMGAMAYPDFLEAQGGVFTPPGEVAGASETVDARSLRQEVGV